MSQSFFRPLTSLFTRRSLLMTRSGTRSLGGTAQLTHDGTFRSHLKDIELPKMNLADFTFEHVNHWRDKVAMRCVLTQEQVTFDELEFNVKAFASGFKSMGYKQGDVVMLAMSNGISFPTATLALNMLGVTVAPINPLCTPYELSKLIQVTEAKGLITQPIFLPNVCEALDNVEMSIQVFADGQGHEDPRIIPLDQVLASSNKTDDVNAFKSKSIDVMNNIALMPFSSGTTGPPKGVMLSHHNLTSALTQYTAGTRTQSLCRENGTLLIFPSFHIMGFLHNLMFNLRYGCTLSFMPAFDYDMFLDVLKDNEPSCVGLVPPLMKRMSQDPKVTKDHFANVRFCGYGGAPIDQKSLDLFCRKLPPTDLCTLLHGYALTESSVVGFDSTRKSNISTLFPNLEVKVIDSDTGRLLPPGAKGELCVRGPQVMKGYFNNPEATAEALIDGWLHTGDVVVFSETGVMHMADRKKDLIKRKGCQVSPSEIEEVIKELPEVDQVAVVGVPCDTDGEVPKAFVVLQEGLNLSAADVHTAVNDKLSAYKQLRGGVEFVDELPTNPSGKILRRQLRN